MVSHQHRCIFVHIPKTAGNSINQIFGVDWQDHKDLARYERELGLGIFTNYFKFAIVRNPWDRLLSDYNYQKKKSRPKESKLFLFKETGEPRTFREWLEVALRDPHRYPPGKWGGEVSESIHRWSPQVDWISLNGRIAVDRVLRIENLAQDIRGVYETLGLPCKRLPRRNSRFHWSYSHYYDDASRDLVATYYADDIKAFGYQFETPQNVLVTILIRLGLYLSSQPARTRLSREGPL